MKKLFLITFFIMGLFLFAKHTNVYAMVCCVESNCTNCGESPTRSEERRVGKECRL